MKKKTVLKADQIKTLKEAKKILKSLSKKFEKMDTMVYKLSGNNTSLSAKRKTDKAQCKLNDWLYALYHEANVDFYDNGVAFIDYLNP